ncbi:exodeoxyribonuclease VII large subunit [Ligilactobacillus cholophilus]|uniref:exodeoxyribonuclease VII large subunit n=1 Tax=Ligilactobacillus cholophilus TaxID=3050131 RepID=UPI0025B120BA|nr:exodeoxyribonuclease VII large subunit [Ligilactobacillus cholophilus]
MQHDQYLTVTALTKYISKKFTYDPYLDKVYLIGEISNFRLRPRHQYFSLKDKNAKIEAVMFQSNFKRIKFQPEEGMKVLVTGKIEVYEQTGKYQINIETMQPDGVGALYKAYEQLKEKLTQEGLFSKPKRELAKFPKRIAVITSPSGAVIRDIITTTRRRYPIVQLVLFPAEVQGEYAKDSLVKRLKEVNKLANFDTIIIGRGGGSIEDLWPFNEEEVARAIANSKIPVISSVGHETDTTLADLAADVRAATPTAAAELATPVLSEVLVKLKDSQVRLAGSMQRIIKNKSNQLTKLKNSFIFTQPERLYDGYVQRLDLAETRLINKIETIFHQNQNRLLMEKNKLEHVSPINRIEKLNVLLDSSKKQLVTLTNNIIKEKISEFKKKEKALELLDPSQIMDRGYSYVTAIKNDAVIKNVDDLSDNEELNLHFKDGVAQVKVLRIRRD